MKYLLTLVLALGTLVMVWLPPLAQAEDPAIQVLQQNITVAYQPPQASAEALLSLPSVYVVPGSFLYWFKHVIEEIRLVLAADPQQRSGLLLEFSQQRLAEGYQAMQHQDWQSAKRALHDYQYTQDELAKSLQSMQEDNTDVDELLQQLKRQLGVQQALDMYVDSKAPAKDAEEISALLQIRPRQTLALATAEGGALLGARDKKQSTSSAQASSSAVGRQSGQQASAPAAIRP